MGVRCVNRTGKVEPFSQSTEFVFLPMAILVVLDTINFNLYT